MFDNFSEIISYELSIQRIPEKRFPQENQAEQLFSTLIRIINVSWATNQHIRIISER